MAQAQFAVPTLDPASVPKYVTDLVIPPAMPQTRRYDPYSKNSVDYYEIAVRQFQQFILPDSLGKQTTVWSYGSVNHPGTFNYPAFTIEARVNRPVRVKWINGLVDEQGNFLQHLLPVDQTLHWANPPGPRDDHGTSQEPYRGPVPIVTHLHGGHSSDESDGYPEAWFLPRAKNIPDGFFRVGSFYRFFKQKAANKYGVKWEPGTATFQYANDQPAATLWYHDHTLGMTRNNVYAGPAGFYLLRGGKGDLPPWVLPGPAPQMGDPEGKKYFEIPLAIQDRSFNDDGSLFYPDSREFFDGFAGPFAPESDIAPIHNPEFFGNTMVVNGKTWPELKVEPRRYRFRLLNGCNSRFIIVKLVAGDPTDPAVRAGNPVRSFWQIGAEGGFLPQVVRQGELLIAPAERADVIVDFSRLPVGTEIYMINRGPDEPFGGGAPGADFPEADPATTGQVMRFKVVNPASKDTSTHPVFFKLPQRRPLGDAVRTRQLTLNELDSAVLPGVGPQSAQLGVLNPDGTSTPLKWDDPVTELPHKGDTEIWELYNLTVDAHPIHLHLVQFEVIDRTPIGDTPGGPTSRPAEPNERGLKDTVTALPGEVTRVKAKFDLAGRYVWHCHIVEHEDNEMMRPYIVEP